jgi:tellurite resistance protein
MFLKSLQEVYKKSMIDLAYFVANIDGNFAEKEKAIITEYQYEMHSNYHPSKKNLDEILASLSGASEVEKKIIFLEIAGLVRVDGIIKESEKHFLSKIATKFGLANSASDESLKIINELNIAYAKAKGFISA